MPVEDGCDLSRIHAYASWGHHVAHEGHALLVELTLWHLGIRFLLAQDLQDASDVLLMLCRVLGEDDDIIEDADADDLQIFTEDIVHKVLEHC